MLHDNSHSDQTFKYYDMAYGSKMSANIIQHHLTFSVISLSVLLHITFDLFYRYHLDFYHLESANLEHRNCDTLTSCHGKCTCRLAM